MRCSSIFCCIMIIITYFCALPLYQKLFYKYNSVVRYHEQFAVLLLIFAQFFFQYLLNLALYHALLYKMLQLHCLLCNEFVLFAYRDQLQHLMNIRIVRLYFKFLQLHLLYRMCCKVLKSIRNQHKLHYLFSMILHLLYAV